MRIRDYPSGASLYVVVAIVGGLDMLLESLSLIVRYQHLAPEAAASLTWRFDAGVTIPVLLLALVYAMGLRRPSAGGEGSRAWRIFAFFAGITLVYFVLESPFDAISDRLFLAHQVQHMTLSMVAPMLIILAAPQATLMRGLPPVARRYVLSPFLGSRVFRVLSVVAFPAIATALYIGTNYFWMIPNIHDAALHDERIHDLMHLTLLLAGLIFFWRVLDPRPYPIGPSLGVRLFMFWLAATSDILLGSFLTFKTAVLYDAYGPSPHLFGITALDDESYGGLTMWIPGSGMMIVAAMLTLRRFAVDEEWREARRPAARETPAHFVARRSGANRKLALGLLSFVGVVLSLTLGVMILYHYGSQRSLLALF